MKHTNYLKPPRRKMQNEIRKLIGHLPQEKGFRQRMRFHQGWWRAFVLAESEGIHPVRRSERIANTIEVGQISHRNFLSENIHKAVMQTIRERQSERSGLLEENRLFNNLLSSQPLCFNFFGELKIDKQLALLVLRKLWPEITEVKRVIFEYSPVQNYTKDNSAFDVAFEVMSDDRKGLIGLECKYTDSFSPKVYDRQEYREIYTQTNRRVFNSTYEELISSKFNQLFRNQLIAEALVQHDQFDFVYTGLFCHQQDTSTIQTAYEFQRMLTNQDNAFKVVTYQAYLEKLQRLDISWEQRELSMLLWARYCGIQLSQQSFA